ncbi:polyketide synthase [Lindgomyces ingoldianus]|uniref:Polyketide synthase n=1 Tax=Lindgomyces ingoldianus TaxID=673940 RepID=A0ACB6Q7K8_9PLEO|nr:polyketide synthase [Lindgomyces ingoldianus]KAF2462795.1 polyketide synthase [Lindgomyces ingoldianus]
MAGPQIHNSLENLGPGQQKAPASLDAIPLRTLPEPIAVVGMGCRLPGGVSTPSDLWDLLEEGRSGYRDFGLDKLNLDGYYHPNPQRPGSVPSRGAHLLDEDPRLFDHVFFGISPAEVLTMDPAHRKMLEVAYEAFEGAGEPWDKFSGSRTGVFVGNFNGDHHLQEMYDIDFAPPYSSTGASSSILSNRINYVFNLRGPSLTVDTACSSSMYALHLAVNALRNGDCDAAIVGGSNLIMSPEMQRLMTTFGALSPTSACHTFDASADGYARGEGFVALYLKRYADAVEGAYPLRALIRATGINSNGRTAGISHPSVEGQEALIRHTYDSASLPTRFTGYFECHGTGTPVGDPIEVAAIGKVFGKDRPDTSLLIGSIKTNLGHSEAASGVSGVIKAILALEKGVIPPTIGVRNLNPNINFCEARVQVVTNTMPWPQGLLKRVSVNSFGYGGANAHCIMDHPDVMHDLTHTRESYSEENPIDYSRHQANRDTKGHPVERNGSANGVHPNLATTRRLVILPFSAHDRRALDANVSTLQGCISRLPLADVAYTLSKRRSKFLVKSTCIVSSVSPASGLAVSENVSILAASAQFPRIGFVFTGQGAQYQDMGRELFDYRVFKTSIQQQDLILKSLTLAPIWSLEDILSGSSDTSVQDPEISQTVCTALQIALFDLLESWSINPHVAIGHSSGEIAAAYAAGFLTLPEAIVTAYCRGKAITKNTREGKMLAVGLSEEAALSFIKEKLEGAVKIAAINSPGSVTLSGDAESVTDLHQKLLADGVFSRLLHTGGNAYHSHHMAPVGEEYENLLDRTLREISGHRLTKTAERSSRCSWISSVTPSKKLDHQCVTVTPAYWHQNLVSPVQFSKAVGEIISNQNTRVDILVELGPHSTLQSPVKQIFAAAGLQNGLKTPVYLPTLKRHEDALRNLLDLCGSLFCLNYPVDLVAVNAVDVLENGLVKYSHGSVCTGMPTYRYNYGPPICHETRIGREIKQRPYLRHDILGVMQPGCAKTRPTWRNVLRIKDVPWVGEHKLHPNAVFPGSGYPCLAIEAAAQFLSQSRSLPSDPCFKLRNIFIKSPMRVVDDENGLEVMLALGPYPGLPNWLEFQVFSVNADGIWTEHAAGMISVISSSGQAMRALESRTNMRHIDTQDWYTKFTEFGLDYGQSFQGLSDLQSDARGNFAQAKVDLGTVRRAFSGPESSYTMHPVTLDICFQLGCIASYSGHSKLVNHVYVPVYIEEMTVWPSKASEAWGHASATGYRKGLRGGLVSIQLRTQSGDPKVEVNNMKCVAYNGGDAAKQLLEENEYTRLVWKPDLAALSNKQARTLFGPTTSLEYLKTTFEDIDKTTMYMIVHIAEQCGSLNPTDTNLKHFLNWINHSATTALPYAEESRLMCSNTRLAAINELCLPLENIIDIKHVKRIFDKISDILTGKTTAMEIALQDNLLKELYTSSFGIVGAYTQLERILDLAAHADPSMKILEIGAGTGGATRIALRSLGADMSTKRYHTYTFTDVSSGFFESAQAEFSRFSDIFYKALDISKNPEEQGFERDFDLIIASQCIHATPDVALTLRHVRRLLKPGGRLILIETTRPTLGHGLAFGTFPNFWTEERLPFISTEIWQKRLKDSGFTGIDIELDDYDPPHHIASTIVTTAAPSQNGAPSTRAHDAVYVVCRQEPGLFQEALSRELQYQNIIPNLITLGDAQIPKNSRIIVATDLDSYTLADSSESEFHAIKEVVQSASSLLWLTAGGLLKGQGPEAAVATGLIRMLNTEHPESRFGIFHVEKGIDCEEAARAITTQEAKLYSGDPEREFAIHDGIVHISRLTLDNDLNSRFRAMYTMPLDPIDKPIHQKYPVIADFTAPGLLSSLYFKRDDSFNSPLPDDYIELETRATGLNWKNLGVATGKVDMDDLSFESAGIVARCGKLVKGLSPGDRVYGFAWGKFGTVTRVPSCMLQLAVPSLTMAELATIPVVFCTATYALNHLARLHANERLLIQSASGGVGLAAIQLAQHIHADIYVTVGSDEKARYLTENFQIPENRIFSSREEGDLSKLMSATGGSGFDVILSLSSGNMMHESWRCIAPRGRFIDVGRLDVMNSGMMAMEVFARNATFCSFDIYTMYIQDRNFCAQLMQEVDGMLRMGIIHPITPLKTFDVSELEKALLYFSRGKHIGKIIVTYEEPKSLVKMRPVTPKAQFDPDAEYLIFGGLGAIGRCILQWMADRGARSFVVGSRSGAPSSEDQSFIQGLPAEKARIRFTRCDVTVKSEINAIITTAPAQRPIRGIIHAAVSFNDVHFESLSYDQWRLGLSAKVTGTINLHEASLEHDLPLDFFIMTSSFQAVLALPAGTAYCAANCFQDAFSRYRRSLGLPACAIGLGPITEIGGMGTVASANNAFRRNGLYSTGEVGLLRLMEGAFLEPPKCVESWYTYDPLAEAQITTCFDPMKLAKNLQPSDEETALAPMWRKDRKFVHIVRAMLDQESVKAPPQRSEVGSISDIVSVVDGALKDGKITDAISIVAEAIMQRIATILMVPSESIDTSKSVAEYGIDSIIAVELRSWIISTLGSSVPLLKILDESVTMTDLGEWIVQNRIIKLDG